MRRQNISSGTRWEEKVGYSRAVRLGNLVYISGTVAVDETGAVVGGDDPYAQTAFALKKILDALIRSGASVTDVVRTRIYVTDIDQWEAVGRAHAEVFGQVKPASTMVEVSRLAGSGLLVEIEVDAVIPA